MSGLTKLEADSASFRFESHDDALNYANKLVEGSVRWQAVNEFNIAKRYKAINLDLRVKCTPRPNAGDFYRVPH